MHPARVARLQVSVSPSSANTSGNTLVTQPEDNGFESSARAMAGLTADGRKKFVSAAETQGWPVGLTPQGANPPLAGPAPTPRGPPTMAYDVGSVSAAK